MPFVEVPPKDLLTDDISVIFEEFKYKMGLPDVPNILKIMSHSENVIKGSWSLIENILVYGTTPRSVKEMLIVAILNSRGGNSSKDSNSAINRMIGIDSDQFRAITFNSEEMHHDILKDVLNFGIKCAKDPQSLTFEDFKTLEHHNFTQTEIIEIISVVGLAVYLNIFVDATRVASDAMFS